MGTNKAGAITDEAQLISLLGEWVAMADHYESNTSHVKDGWPDILVGHGIACGIAVPAGTASGGTGAIAKQQSGSSGSSSSSSANSTSSD